MMMIPQCLLNLSHWNIYTCFCVAADPERESSSHHQSLGLMILGPILGLLDYDKYHNHDYFGKYCNHNYLTRL